MVSFPSFQSCSRLAVLLAAFSLGACASRSHEGATPQQPAKSGAYYKVGKPYQINGIWYYPKEDYSYDETGIASWYGADFHMQRTANGDIFNKNELTAAHPTLPMPSLARVTNLENGRSIVVRINDRGPFSGARVIDVTERAAQLLGFAQQGTAKVRVQVLADESKAIADAMRRYGKEGPAPTETGAPSSVAPASVQTALIAPPADRQPESNAPVVQEQELPPLPKTHKEARAMMQTLSPVPIARQLPLTAQTQIYIQAGAFSKMENANGLRRKLGHLGKTSISEVVVRGTKFYRVRLGPVADVTAADALLKKVRSSGASTARTVVDTPEN